LIPNEKNSNLIEKFFLIIEEWDKRIDGEKYFLFLLEDRD